MSEVVPDPNALNRSLTAYNSFARWSGAGSVWVYQTWIWRGMSSATDAAYLAGWLAGPPPGCFFLLDQTAERLPVWQLFANFSYYGHAFVWLTM